MNTSETKLEESKAGTGVNNDSESQVSSDVRERSGELTYDLEEKSDNNTKINFCLGKDK